MGGYLRLVFAGPPWRPCDLEVEVSLSELVKVCADGDHFVTPIATLQRLPMYTKATRLDPESYVY